MTIDLNTLERLADGIVGGWSKSRTIYEPEATTIKALIAELKEARECLHRFEWSCDQLGRPQWEGGGVMLVTITTDELSGQQVRINTMLIESIRFDRLGANSPSAYHIRMASGAVIKCNKANGERIIQAMESEL